MPVKIIILNRTKVHTPKAIREIVCNASCRYKLVTSLLSMDANPDETEYAQLPDGRSTQVAPNGSAVVSMPDGTVFQSTPDGQNLIKKPDGSIQNISQEQYKSELDRYNDWYIKQLENKLNGK